ncbi:uncharacterized protein LOC142358517, partial [Convolutriloba macropyga]|uniref:uncharacterized protein LOC142358517 n=1 Tax=Convolutriloba macropyga TaxID=536237 RepID=UPI003F51BAFA
PNEAERTENVLALLRLKHYISANIAQSIPICETAVRQGELIGVCGMGSTRRTEKIYPSVLHEAIFSVNFLQKGFIPFVDPLHFCDDSDICTDKINDANSCLNDAGSPVYQFECRVDDNGVAIRQPKCLYGIVKPIANESKDQSGQYTGCKGEEIFVNVTHFRPQITSLIENYIL